MSFFTKATVFFCKIVAPSIERKLRIERFMIVIRIARKSGFVKSIYLREVEISILPKIVVLERKISFSVTHYNTLKFPL